MRLKKNIQVVIWKYNNYSKAKDWEEVKKKGDAGIKKWIDDNMN